MSNRFKIKRRRPKRRAGRFTRTIEAVNEVKRRERAEAKAAGFPSRKRYLRALKRQHKGEAKVAPVPPRLRQPSPTFTPAGLKEMNLPELRHLADVWDVRYNTKTRKDDLIARILEEQKVRV